VPAHERALVSIAVVAAVAGLPPPIASARQEWDLKAPVVNVSRVHGSQSETAVAINPTNPLNVVITSNLQDFTGLLRAFSLDGGRTWSTAIIANGGRLGVACCDSSLAFDRFGNLFLTYLLYSTSRVPIAVSTDGGASFHRLSFITPVLGDLVPPGRRRAPPTSVSDQPTITTGPGSVWVTFTGGASAQAAGAAVHGLGDVEPFHPVQVAAGTNVGHFGDVAVGPEGQVLIAYQEPTGELPSRILTDLDPDGLGPKGFDPARVAVVTGVGDYDSIPAQPLVTVDAEAGLGWDRSGGAHRGRVYLVYTSEFPDESDDTDVQVKYSDDEGDSWSPPVRVNDDTGVNSQFNPKMAVDQTTGTVAVAWYDCRADLGQGGQGDTDGIPNDDAVIFAGVSVDGGLTFTIWRIGEGASNSVASRNPLEFGDYEGLAFDSGTFYPVWADNSNSTGDNPDGTLHGLDVYTSAVRAR
jgi:hypothetical protein